MGPNKCQTCLIFSLLQQKSRDILSISKSLGFFVVLCATNFFLIFDRVLCICIV